jgi:hypothetical protein
MVTSSPGFGPRFRQDPGAARLARRRRRLPGEAGRSHRPAGECRLRRRRRGGESQSGQRANPADRSRGRPRPDRPRLAPHRRNSRPVSRAGFGPGRRVSPEQGRSGRRPRRLSRGSGGRRRRGATGGSGDPGEYLYPRTVYRNGAPQRSRGRRGGPVGRRRAHPRGGRHHGRSRVARGHLQPPQHPPAPRRHRAHRARHRARGRGLHRDAGTGQRLRRRAHADGLGHQRAGAEEGRGLGDVELARPRRGLRAHRLAPRRARRRRSSPGEPRGLRGHPARPRRRHDEAGQRGSARRERAGVGSPEQHSADWRHQAEHGQERSVHRQASARSRSASGSRRRCCWQGWCWRW